MHRRNPKSVAVAGALAAFVMASAPAASALEVYRSYSAGCARWERQGAGQRIKCFDCLQPQRINGRRFWVNTCAHGAY